DRHEVDQRGPAGRILELGLENQRVRTIAPADVPSAAVRRDPPAAMFRAAEERGEACRCGEVGPAQPIDGAVAPDERCGQAIADERIVFDARGPRASRHAIAVHDLVVAQCDLSGTRIAAAVRRRPTMMTTSETATPRSPRQSLEAARAA